MLLHGLLMNDTQWNLALPHLPAGFRYLLPVLPMGGHRIPMREDADLTLPGMVDIVADFLDALDLADVTLVVTDWGGPLLPHRHRTGQTRCATGDLPIGGVRQLPARASRARSRGWQPQHARRCRWRCASSRSAGCGEQCADVRTDGRKLLSRRTLSTNGRRPALPTGGSAHDLVKYCRTKFDKAELIRATNRLADFEGDVLVLWSRNPVMPDDHATRLAELTERDTALRRRRQRADHARPARADSSGAREVLRIHQTLMANTHTR